ncbi:formyl-CoA transferase [Bordetella genomosp. 5]|uniref:CaiB/BaiF CoA transferase family protein n=1 Tax=Bordetella genomosp. 5 TaxID=1395608 RepID=UPI000B9DED8F|nr:CaiB/BaiF CoA-transferase family protein [Bordetella genomosp. 5]OZI46211.1 formyl-CoA transferase [Bordetella genomosp. 5]
MSRADQAHTAQADTAAQDAPPLPLAGIRVIEFTHMVMGPTCGMVLADLGAEVIKIEPVQGDNTRRLKGSGAGFFAMFNRNKKSIPVDLHDPRGRELVLRLIATADIVSENFKPGAMARLGLDYESLQTLNPGLIYVSHKGFLPGPYEHRTALDEVVQMMGGLAYMTGPEGRPLRAGAAVNDIMGGMFGALGAMAALIERRSTGRGQQVQSALFENNVFLVGHHMMQYAVTGQAAAPMPSRISAWAVYDVFTVAEGGQIFLAVVSDTQWRIFCEAFGFVDLADDTRLATNNARVDARPWLMPILRERLAGMSAASLAQRFEQHGLPYAPIARPQDLFDDPHLAGTGGLAEIAIPDGARAGEATRVPLLPITLGGRRPGVRAGPPALGACGAAVLDEAGIDAEARAALIEAGVLGPVT